MATGSSEQAGRSVGWAAMAAQHVDPGERPLPDETPTQTRDRIAAEKAGREREALRRYGLLKSDSVGQQTAEGAEETG